MIRQLFRLALIAVAFFAASLPLHAEEAITSFDSKIVLLTDESVDVTETITVNAEGNQIRRGIFREIFTTMVNDDRSRVRPELKVVSVTRDGAEEPYTTERLVDPFNRSGRLVKGTRIRIGDPDVFIENGSHTYVIRYTMTRMARRFDTHDELYWNVTGNFWQLPIENATASVELPQGASIGNLTGFTGPFGSKAKDLTFTKTSDNTAEFAAQRRFEPGEGLTIAVSFNKGILGSVGGPQGAMFWVSDNRNVILPSLAALIVLLYNFFAWNAVGRDPPKGTVIPLFHAPKGMSPGLMHYIHQYGWKGDGWKAFIAGIFNLGVKGQVRIDNPDKTLTVTATGAGSDADLGAGEKVLSTYFQRQGSVTVGKATGPELLKQRNAFKQAIEAENQGKFFSNNLLFVGISFVLALVALAGLYWLEVLDVTWLIIAVIAGAVFGLAGTFINKLFEDFNFIRFGFFVIVFLVGFNVVGTAATALADLQFDTAAIAAGTIIAISIIFGRLMRAPTIAGRKAMDEIDGFKMYLETAEKNRMNLVGEPPMTVGRFEAILPYAIALGVEKPWAKHFETELARNGVSDASGANYSPGWYSGRSFASGGVSGAVNAATAAMTAAMIAAQPASSSSSGFSSRGSSGGGGGGGGGGGW